MEDSREAHKAIITRLAGDLRCERYCTCMLMHIGRPISPSPTHPPKPYNLPCHIESQNLLIIFTDV